MKKCSTFYIIAFFASQILISCSDNASKEESATITPPTSGDSLTTAPTIEAKEKKTDVATQGMKGKVEVMSESMYLPGSSKRSTSKNVFKYDDKGNRLELVNYAGDRINSTVRSTYDADGKLIKEETVSGDGTVDLISEIKTDAKGNKVEQQDKRQNSSTILFNYKYLYKYDEKGQEIERTAFRGNGTFLFRYSFIYDDNGNRIEWVQVASDSSVTAKVIYKYDDKNNLIEESEYEKGNKLKAAYTYTYEFDKKGNWIRRTKLQKNSPVEIKERQISYH
jgi:hypothetical protein